MDFSEQQKAFSETRDLSTIIS